MGEMAEKVDISLSSPYQVPVGLWKQGVFWGFGYRVSGVGCRVLGIGSLVIGKMVEELRS